MADVAKLRVIFEGDTQDLDRAYAHAKKQEQDYKRWHARQGGVELDADADPLEQEIAGAQKTLTRYRATATKNALVDLDADGKPLERTLVASQNRFKRYRLQAQRESNVELDADATGVTAGVAKANAALATLPEQKEVNIDVDSGAAVAKIGGLGAMLGARSAGSVLAGLSQIGAAARGAFVVAIPVAIGAALAALQPLMGGAGVIGATVLGVVGGFGLMAAAGMGTFRKITKEGGKFVAATGEQFTASQQKMVDSLNRAGNVWAKAFRPANDAFNRVAARVIFLSSKALPALGEAARKSTNAIGRGFEYAFSVMREPQQLQSMQRILASMPRISESLTKAAGTFGAGLVNIFGQAAPYAEQLANWIQKISLRFLNWTQSEKGRRQIESFFKAAAVIGPHVVDAVVDISRGIIFMGKAAGGAARLLFKFVGFMDKLAGYKKGESVWDRGMFELPKFDFQSSGVMRVARAVGNAAKFIAGEFRKSWARSWDGWKISYQGSALQKMWQKVRGDSDKTKNKVGQDQRALEGNLGNIWGRVSKLANKWWASPAGVMRKIISSSTKAKEEGGLRQRELEGNLSNVWGRVAKAAGKWWLSPVGIMKKILESANKSKEGAGKSHRELGDNLSSIWNRIKDGAKPLWEGINRFIIDPTVSMVKTVKDAWGNLIEFINKILDGVGIDKKLSVPETGSVGAGGRARGGLDSGKYNDPSRQPLYMARGGITDRPRVVYGEAGPEAYITLGRYTRESAEALTKANDVWASRGWLDKAREQNAGGRRREGGEGLGPTHYNLVPEVKSKADAIAKATGTSWNSYVGHGQLGGSTSEYTADFWGPGGRGDPISKSAGFKTADLALQKYNADPALLYMIRQGEYWRNGGWSSNTFGDPHYDHTHVSWDSPGGASPGGGFFASLWETIGEPLWNRLVQPVVGRFEKMVGGGNMMAAAGAKASLNAVGSIKDWIISQVGSMGSGGDLDAWIKDGLSFGGAFPPTSGNISQMRGRAEQESGGDPRAQNNWDSNAAAGTPSKGLFQIIEPTWNSYRSAMGGDAGSFDSNWDDPRMSTAVASRYMKSRYGHIVGAGGGGYGMGGIIPGPGGKPMFVQAHGGERVLPREMVKSFDRLAFSINNAAKGGERAHRTAQGLSGGVSLSRGGVAVGGLSVSSRGVSIGGVHLVRAANAQEDTARTMRRVERRIGDLDKKIGREVRESVNKNIERGLNTNRSISKSEARREARRLAGGARISRAL